VSHVSSVVPKTKAPIHRSAVAGPKAPPKSVDPTLRKAIKTFESAGGQGVWFEAKSPWAGPDDKPQACYLLKALPPESDPKSDITLMDSAHGRDLLAQTLKGGIPVVMVVLPTELDAISAAAIGGDEFGDKTLKAANCTSHNTIVMIQPGCDEYVLAHECQHWADYEDASFQQSLTKDLKPFKKLLPSGVFTTAGTGLPQTAMEFLTRMVLELRGHAAQALQAEACKAAKVPFVIGSGRVMTGKKADGEYDMEVGMAAGNFRQAYSDDIFDLFTALKKADSKAPKLLAHLIAKYDFSDKPGNPATFAKLFPILAK